MVRGWGLRLSKPSIEDEHGIQWLVEAGDPARTSVLALSRAGFVKIVLPRELLRGTLDPARAKELATLAAASAAVSATLTSSAAIARAYRLADCLEVLSA